VDPVERQQLEHPIRQAIAAEDRNGATTAVLRLYGGELYGFLCSVARDQTIADEAYSELCEVVWKQLGAFRWEASLRSWLYALARRLVLRLRVDGYRRAARARPLELAPEVIEVAARMRTSTLEIQRSDVKSAFRALRDELSEEDQELLALRVDRDLSWRDIARILESGDELVEAGVAAEGASRASPAIDSLAATLRKRFERVRGRLRELASERGLLPEGD
jgi:RNA polymerase sigma-70 factor (ECF subfamily)